MTHWLMKRLACLALLLASTAALADERKPGSAYMGPDIQAMQKDDMANPGMLWVQDGAALWSRKPAPEKKACADCHGDAATSMKGAAARYPAFDAEAGRPIDLSTRINLCREKHQQAPPFAPESESLLGLGAWLGLQSRGLPIVPDPDPRTEPHREQGRRLYEQRMGQLNFSCAQCHDAHAGKRLAGSVIPEAHPTGYPIYRLEWQGMGSLQRRLRNCMTGVRAEPFAYGAPEMIELELFLMSRAAGMTMETPGVRP